MATPALQIVILYFVLPLWIAAGFADWACHRASDIESTTGSRESLFHLAMLVEVGVPLVAALFPEINALMFLLLLFAFAVHEATAIWDVSFATQSMRIVTPFEQHTHSFLELLPLFGILALICLPPAQFLSLFHQGKEPPSLFPVLKQHGPGSQSVTGLLLATLLLNVVPFGEELLRCIRSERKRSFMDGA